MKKSLNSIKFFMMDMDGTIYLGNRLLPGAQEFLGYLNNKGKDFLFLTNNSSKHAGLYAEKFRRLGLQIPQEKIFTSGEATTIYLNNRMPKSRIYLVGTQALEQEFTQSGFTLTDQNPDAVVLGFDTGITYEKFRQICDFIREGKPYFATHPDLNCPTEDGFMPDVGAFIALIKASTDREPDEIIGKPKSHIVNAVKDKTGYALDEIAMIGDRLYTDIALGETGITTILMLSGETKSKDLEESPFSPDYIFENLNRLVDYLIE